MSKNLENQILDNAVLKTKIGQEILENYIKLGEEIGILVGKKQQAYGDSFGRSGAVLKEMFPDGIQPSQYGDLLTIARILDKLFRLANQPKAFDESPYRDICGYALLGINRHINKETKHDKDN